MACDTSTCGSGLVDAQAAVLAAQQFNPQEPGVLAAAIADDEQQVLSGGSGRVHLLLLLLMLLAFCSRHHYSILRKRKAFISNPWRP